MVKLAMATVLVAGCLAAGGAQAAGNGVIPSWTGPYVGAQAGYVWGQGSDPAFNWTVNPTGGIAGAFAGFNYDFGGVVVGVEGGVNGAFATGSGVTGGAFSETYKANQNWEASVVGRIGVPVHPNLLLYGLAGWSVTEFTGNFVHVGPPNSPSASAIVNGWTVGGGGEYRLTKTVSLRGEYRYASYGGANLTCSTCGPTIVNFTTSTATIGLLAHF